MTAVDKVLFEGSIRIEYSQYYLADPDRYEDFTPFSTHGIVGNVSCPAPNVAHIQTLISYGSIDLLVVLSSRLSLPDDQVAPPILSVTTAGLCVMTWAGEEAFRLGLASGRYVVMHSIEDHAGKESHRIELVT